MSEQFPLFELVNDYGDSLEIFPPSDETNEAPAEHPVLLAELLLDMYEANPKTRILGVSIDEDGVTINAKVISDEQAAEEGLAL